MIQKTKKGEFRKSRSIFHEKNRHNDSDSDKGESDQHEPETLEHFINTRLSYKIKQKLINKAKEARKRI